MQCLLRSIVPFQFQPLPAALMMAKLASAPASRERPELETITHWAHPLKKPRFDAQYSPPPLSATSLFFLSSIFVRGRNPKSVGIQGRQAGSSSPPKKGGGLYCSWEPAIRSGGPQSLLLRQSTKGGEKGPAFHEYQEPLYENRKICEMARNVIFLFLLLWRPSMQQVRTV